jgi:hypothetical protein
MVALFSKRSLVDWLRTELGAGYGTALLEIQMQRESEADAPWLFTNAKLDGVAFAARWAEQLDTGHAYWTSPDMVSLVDQAAQELPDDFEIYPDDLIEPSGMAYLARSINIAGVLVCAISWATIGSKISMVAYAPRHGQGDPIGEQIARTSSKHLPLLVPVNFQAQSFRTPVSNGAIRRFMAAWWKLIDQRLATRERTKPRGSELKKEKRLRSGDLVTEVRLRSPKSVVHRDHDPSWAYSHRFFVRGHWRDQPYKDGSVERIYIATYVKGPADKPLVIRTHIYRWDR